MSQTQKASILMILSALSFSVMQIAVKYTARTVPVPELVFVRNFFMLIIAYCTMKSKKKKLFKDKKNLPLIIARGVFGMLGVILYFYATKYLPSAEASVLQKSSPFFVALFAFLLLKEPLSKVDILSMILAFIGVVIVSKPSGDFSIYSVLAFLSAIFAAMAYVAIGMLKGKEDSHTIMLSFAIITCVSTLPFVLLNFKLPNSSELIGLTVIGITGALGQYFLTMGYMGAPAGKVSIFNYTSVIFASILGYIMFGDTIDIYSAIGIVLIFVAALMVYFDKNKK